MTYDKDLEVLTSIRNKITLGIYHAEEVEALDDAISAIQTLSDMGDTMCEILRSHHIKSDVEMNCTKSYKFIKEKKHYE